MRLISIRDNRTKEERTLGYVHGGFAGPFRFNGEVVRVRIGGPLQGEAAEADLDLILSDEPGDPRGEGFLSFGEGDCLIRIGPDRSPRVVVPGFLAVSRRVSFWRPLRTAVLTVSDKGSRGDRVDTAGPTLAELAESQGCLVFDRAIVPDEIDRIASVVRQWSEEEKADLILTTGGTGLAPRDVTPEALTSLADRVLPGFGERMRTATQAQHPRAFLTRSIAVTHAGTLIVAFPGSERAVRQCFEAVAPGLRHAVETFKGWEGECGGSVGGGSHR